MEKATIAFIGGGNMASSLIGGLVAHGTDPQGIWVAEPVEDRRKQLQERFGVQVGADNAAAARQAEVIVLAVKPQVMHEVAKSVADVVQEQRPLVVSIAAGIRSHHLERWLGDEAAVVRTMPNTPALVQSGATALYANARVSPGQRDRAESILRAVGLTLWVSDEDLMDTITALSGSGPAYYFLVMEAMEAAAVRLGLSKEAAHLLTLQTAFGAAKMALESPDNLVQLRHHVTSPGGTTERGVKALEEARLREAFDKALRAARDRSVELSGMLGDL